MKDSKVEFPELLFFVEAIAIGEHVVISIEIISVADAHLHTYDRGNLDQAAGKPLQSGVLQLDTG